MAVLVETQDLKKYFKSGAGMVHAVDNISFKIQEGETVGLVRMWKIHSWENFDPSE